MENRKGSKGNLWNFSIAMYKEWGLGNGDSGMGNGVAYCCLGLCGLRVLKFDGAIAPRVLKFDSGFAAEGCCRAPLNYRRRQFV